MRVTTAVLALLLIAFSGRSFGVDVEIDDISYSLNENDLTAYMYRESSTFTGTHLVIPDFVSYNGQIYSVETMATFAFEKIGLTSLVIGNNITEISNSAFQSLTMSTGYPL